LEDEKEEIMPIDISCVGELVNELKEASTLKKLFSIDDVEKRFEESFIAICRFANFNKNFQKLNVIFTSFCKAELEVDYFKHMGGNDV
jgi:hypothetical protein